MAVEIKFSQAYFWLNSWVLANIIQLGTQSFCDRFVDYRIDPGRRLYDQMTLAARCGVANIAEGTARHSTSIETEMRLLDVARASIDELQGDFFNFLLRRGSLAWSTGNPDREALWKINLDSPQYTGNLLHEASKHILRQKSKYDPWIENASAEVVANSMLILCVRVNKMIESLIQERLEVFKVKGGFSENMTATRMEARRNETLSSGGPLCPLCGKPMLKRMQKKGAQQGREFWGCSDYPSCNGIRHIK